MGKANGGGSFGGASTLTSVRSALNNGPPRPAPPAIASAINLGIAFCLCVDQKNDIRRFYEGTIPREASMMP